MPSFFISEHTRCDKRLKLHTGNEGLSIEQRGYL